MGTLNEGASCRPSNLLYRCAWHRTGRRDGFRVFLPMLIVSVAAYTGHLAVGESFGWLATPAALTMLGAAALAEIVAYYVAGG